MGGSSSKSKTVLNQVSNAITEIAMKSVLDCRVSSDQSQSTVVNNTGWSLFGTYKMTQQSDINSKCFQDSAKEAKLQNDIINTVKQATASENSSLLGAFGSSSSSAETNLTTLVKNSVNMQTIQKNYNSIKQSQSIVFNNSGVVGFQQSELTQGASIFAAATLKALDDAGVFNKITTYVDQQSDSKISGPFSFDLGLGNLFSGSYIWLFIIFIAVIIGYKYFVTKQPESQDQQLPQ